MPWPLSSALQPPSWGHPHQKHRGTVFSCPRRPSGCTHRKWSSLCAGHPGWLCSFHAPHDPTFDHLLHQRDWAQRPSWGEPGFCVLCRSVNRHSVNYSCMECRNTWISAICSRKKTFEYLWCPRSLICLYEYSKVQINFRQCSERTRFSE